jgi:hypothetical protein
LGGSAKDPGEGIVQIVVPEFAEALLTDCLARGQWGGAIFIFLQLGG